MSNEITPESFARLVELAALALTGEESEYLRRELNRQLRVVEELADIPLPEGTPPASHGVPYPPGHRPPLREDRAMPSGLEADLLAQAPESDEGYFVVPDIPHETL